MNEMYSEVREHLRSQHQANIQEIHGKRVDNFSKYSYYDESEDWNRRIRKTSGKFVFKVLLFLTCVMLFSCYLYGGQDVKKGAVMAWNDMNKQITKLEEDEPAVKQTMGYVRKTWNEVKDFTKTYLNIGE